MEMLVLGPVGQVRQNAADFVPLVAGADLVYLVKVDDRVHGARFHQHARNAAVGCPLVREAVSLQNRAIGGTAETDHGEGTVQRLGNAAACQRGLPVAWWALYADHLRHAVGVCCRTLSARCRHAERYAAAAPVHGVPGSARV